jgi:hypothetical protein
MTVKLTKPELRAAGARGEARSMTSPEINSPIVAAGMSEPTISSAPPAEAMLPLATPAAHA